MRRRGNIVGSVRSRRAGPERMLESVDGGFDGSPPDGSLFPDGVDGGFDGGPPDRLVFPDRVDGGFDGGPPDRSLFSRRC